MSGPKISVYALTGRARQIVDGQIRCEQQALVCGEQIQSILSSCSRMKHELDQSLQLLEALQNRNGGQEEKIDEVKSIKAAMDGEIQKIQSEFSRNIPRRSVKYFITEEAYARKKKDLERIQAIRKEAEDLKSRLDEAAGTGKEAGLREQKKTQSVIAEYLNDDGENGSDLPGVKDEKTLKENISDGFGGALSFEGIEEDTVDTAFEDRKKAIRKGLGALLERDLSGELETEIKNAISRLDQIRQMQHLTTYESVTVKKLYRNVDVFEKQREKERAVLKEKKLRYQVLCEMAGKETEKARMFSDEQELDDAVHELEVLIARETEQTYIADCVDEVMEEMGYDLIGKREVRKRSGKHFKNELYQFGEGTAVNVTYSPEGQISMELGGISREDRIPTEEETTVLTKDMVTFCGEFAEFERRMKEKGILVGKRVALMPPEAEYAAIINVNDYEMRPDMEISEMDVSAGRKKAASGKKTLRRED